jgi:hypothetical protein
MANLHDLTTASDEELLVEMARLLDPSWDGVHQRLPAISVYQLELSRRSLREIMRLSRRLERLTFVLVAISVLLVLVALPPAIEGFKAFAKWWHM